MEETASCSELAVEVTARNSCNATRNAPPLPSKCTATAGGSRPWLDSGSTGTEAVLVPDIIRWEYRNRGSVSTRDKTLGGPERRQC
eukprot:2623417-Rhodomonas_salina.1